MWCIPWRLVRLPVLILLMVLGACSNGGSTSNEPSDDGANISYISSTGLLIVDGTEYERADDAYEQFDNELGRTVVYYDGIAYEPNFLRVTFDAQLVYRQAQSVLHYYTEPSNSGLDILNSGTDSFGRVWFDVRVYTLYEQQWAEVLRANEWVVLVQLDPAPITVTGVG